ncbi:hypothetical protein PFISCL1PPCAC_21281, partial [Pristionchus fissidentatus]
QMPSLPDVVIRMEIDKISRLHEEENGRSSDVVYAKNLPWRLLVEAPESVDDSSDEDDGYDEKVLGVELKCDTNCETSWSCDASIEIVILNKNAAGNRVEKLHEEFGIGNRSGGWNFGWASLTDPEKGFIEDDTVVVECRVWIEKTTGIRKLRLIDYTRPIDDVTNVVLVVEGKKLHVSKDYLALHSPFFSAMFYGGFRDAEKEQIELKVVEYDEFVDLLNVIFPTSIEITDESVAHILKLADRFQIESVLDRAESYLIDSFLKDKVEKLVFADQYRLDLLMEHALDLYSNVPELKALKPTSEYKRFSDKTKSAICDRILEM